MLWEGKPSFKVCLTNKNAGAPKGTPAPEPQGLLGGKVQLAPDLYGIFDRPSHRAAILIHFEHPLYGLAVFFVGVEVDSVSNPLENKNLVLGFYLPNRVGVEAVFVEGNLTRCQRA